MREGMTTGTWGNISGVSGSEERGMTNSQPPFGASAKDRPHRCIRIRQVRQHHVSAMRPQFLDIAGGDGAVATSDVIYAPPLISTGRSRCRLRVMRGR